MVSWFKRLFHFHEWKIIKQGPITRDFIEPWGRKSTRNEGFYYDLQCQICGNIKTKRK